MKRPGLLLAAWLGIGLFVSRAHAIVGSNTGTDPPWNGLSVNTFVGAGTFYSMGFGGSRAIVANIEAGAIWDGHETLSGRVSRFIADPAIVSTGTTQLGQFDWHATMVGQTLGGSGLYTYQEGIAPTSQLWSGAIATAWLPSGSDPYVGGFDVTDESFLYPYVAAMRTGFVSGTGTLRARVVNSSWGYGGDSDASNPGTIAIDALSLERSVVTVVAAGNGGPAANTVGGPATGYNVISVGGLKGDASTPPYGQSETTSSRGPSDFYNPQTQVTVAGVRPTVDIAAPGTDMTLAFYGGLTGGHISGTAVSGNAYYFSNMDGTSFAAPIVAGGAALMVDAGTLFVDSGVASSEMLDARVIKAALMAGARAPAGWSNGQASVDGVITTTQALDYVTGAGILDLDSTYRLYVGDPSAVTIDNVTYVMAGLNTTLGVAGSSGGTGLEHRGWDLGSVLSSSTAASGRVNTYSLATPFAAGDTLTAALTWFADRTLGTTLGTAADVALGNLALEIWRADAPGIETLVARSTSSYSTTEFLRYTVEQAGSYDLRVVGSDQLYNLGGPSTIDTSYGLAWVATPVPEPATIGLAVVAAGAGIFHVVRRRRAAA